MRIEEEVLDANIGYFQWWKWRLELHLGNAVACLTQEHALHPVRHFPLSHVNFNQERKGRKDNEGLERRRKSSMACVIWQKIPPVEGRLRGRGKDLLVGRR